MTTRIAGLLVTLSEDMRDDDIEPITSALLMLKGVLTVEPVEANIDQQVAAARVTTKVKRALVDMMRGL